MKNLKSVKNKVESHTRISREDAEFLFEHASDEYLQEISTIAKSRFHRTDEATYLIMAIINYTNICVAKCDYCAFYRLPHQTGTYLLNFDEICARIDRVLDFGGTMVGFNGGFHPKLRVHDYADMFNRIRSRYGDNLEFYGMTVAEFVFACRVSKLDLNVGAELLRSHGSRWITGGGAEILDNDFRRRHSPGKFTVEEYYGGQQAILASGMNSTATMVIGFDETLTERMNHLESLRQFQDRQSVKMPSFLCWTYKPYHTELGGTEISTREYLRWLAVCRIYLDNFEHIRTSVLTKNQDALLGLKFGANDFDLPTEDEVTQKAGAKISLDFERILAAAVTLGFKPVHRKPFAPLSSDANVPSCASRTPLLSAAENTQ